MEAKNKFDENFYNLMINSVYGKMCENPRNRIQAYLIRSEEELLEQVAKFNFKSLKIFNEDLAAVTLRKTQLTWSKPLIVGATILDLSKTHIFNFHYNIMKKNFNCDLLYSDRDSLTYKNYTQDLYHDLQANTELNKHYDFSNYPSNSPLYSNKNKKTVLRYKDELCGCVMKEFIGLKSKVYSIIAEGKLLFQIFKKHCTKNNN